MPRRRVPHVRPQFLAALAAAIVLAGVLAALPSPEERMVARWDRAAADYAAGGCALLRDPEGRARYLGVLEELAGASADRRLAELAPLGTRCGTLAPDDARRYLGAALKDAEDWSAAYPDWRREALRRYAGSGLLAEQTRRGLARAPVELVFDAGASYPRLWLEGSWDADGGMDNLGGWRDVPLAPAGGGVWTRKESLALTRVNDPYHVVVRTAPWPKGRTVGYASFRVDGPARVSVGRAAPPAPRPADAPYAGPRTRVSVLGIDGATWRVVLPLVRLGRLPHFRRLLEEGAVADLWSTGHYGSIENIRAALTGRLPLGDESDAADHYRVHWGRKPAKLWRIASDAGLRSLVVSAWETFPPEPVKGELVSEAFFALELGRRPGMKELAASPEVQVFAERFGVSAANIRDLMKLLGRVDGVLAATWPGALEADLRARLPAPAGTIEDLPGVARAMDERIAQAVQDLSARSAFDLSVSYVSEIDNNSHEFWGGFEAPVRSYKTSVRDPRVRAAVAALPPEEGRLAAAYERADALLGVLMERSDHVLAFSDHGFGSDWTDYLYLLFSLDRFVADLGAREKIALPAGAEVQGRGLEYRLWLPRGPESDRYLERLTRRLRGTRYLPHGSPAFSEISVETRGDRVVLHFFQEQPHPIFINGIEVEGEKRSVMDFFDLSMRQGTHKPNGLAALWGPGVRPGRFAPAYEPDVTPTALYLLGLPAARDMDGRVLTEAFQDAELARRPVAWVPTHGTGSSPLANALRSIRWTTLARRLLGRR